MASEIGGAILDAVTASIADSVANSSRGVCCQFVNNSSYLLIVDCVPSPGIALHGFTLISSRILLPHHYNREFLGCASDGFMTGTEAYYRISVWDAATDLKPIDPSLQSIWVSDRLKYSKIQLDNDTFVLGPLPNSSESITAKQVSTMYVMLDSPWSGENKINVVEMDINTANTAYTFAAEKLSPDSKLTAGYNIEAGGDCALGPGIKLRGYMRIEHGNNVKAYITVTDA
ncbi:hypothetical protein IMSHALPRED_005055 [Imshaugia aleurites]|uniref:Uncharacterized protein n=1 Tax=Imshaugia aleurites TaxID=172621 RepID=A0A8H3IHG1_9LECA|nr:hypothetical protein IMSHALPRED_005055 [Imshaugia aleurites]